MKLKVYAVRYKEDITPFVESYYSDPTIDHSQTSLTIINNYGILDSTDKYTILNNVLRPDFSTGHLARNWNQAIVNGFKDLNNPDCDVVLCLQIDAIFTNNWYSITKSIFENKEFDYIQVGRGDEYQYFTPAIIKKVGLYDERCCTVGYQEREFLLRVLLTVLFSERGKDLKISINDYIHQCVYNPVKKDVIKESYYRPSPEHILCLQYVSISLNVYLSKWGDYVRNPFCWNLTEISKLSNINFKKEYKYYPYFEKDINSDIYMLE